MATNRCNRQPIKKSIVRNVDIKKQRRPAEELDKISEKPAVNLPKFVKKDLRDYSEPRKNTLTGMKQRLDDLNEYSSKEAIILQKTAEKIAEMEGKFDNMLISKQLNFPPNIPIYKNLPPIYDPEKSIRADKLIKQTKNKMTSTTNTQTSSKEINDLLRQLVDLEYEEKELTSTDSKATSKLIGEDEYFGLHKFKEPNFYLPTDKEDNENFIQDNIEKTNVQLFDHETYGDFIPFHLQPRLPKNPGCGCLLKQNQQKHEESAGQQ